MTAECLLGLRAEQQWQEELQEVQNPAGVALFVGGAARGAPKACPASP